MIKAVLIDDERPALKELAYLLGSYDRIEVAGMFADPRQGMEHVEAVRPQVVFLDINMPQLTGIDAASRILDLCPETDVVFVTAYDRYAVEAFDLYALDYLLKPVSRERLDKTVKRIIAKNGIKNDSSAHHPPKTLQIKCLGRLQVGWERQEPVKWRTGKTRELFAFLLHNRGRELSKNEIIDAVWPEVEVEKASHQLHNAVYYIRKTLEEYGIARGQVSISGGYCLRLGKQLELDVELFTKALAEFKTSPSAAKGETAAELFTGEYFDGGDWLWAAWAREGLLKQYWQLVYALAEIYMQNMNYEKAESLLKGAYAGNPYEERASMLLMELYITTGEKAKAQMHYLEYSRMLEKELGIKPGESIRRLNTTLQK